MVLTSSNFHLQKFSHRESFICGWKNDDMEVSTQQLGSIKLDCLIFSIVPLQMSHVSLHVSLRVLFRLSARLVKLQKLHFLDRYTIPYIKLYTFQKSGMRVQSSWLFLISADWNDSEHLVVRELKFDPRFDFGRAEKKSCSDVFFDGSEFRTASGDTASVVSTDFMKFKILKKFSKISKFSQIISCRQHWLWNHVICQDWWVKSIDFWVNSRKMGKSGKINSLIGWVPSTGNLMSGLKF